MAREKGNQDFLKIIEDLSESKIKNESVHEISKIEDEKNSLKKGKS